MCHFGTISQCGVTVYRSYTVDLVTFLEVAGGMQITFGGIAILGALITVTGVEIPHWLGQCNCCVGLFYLIWVCAIQMNPIFWERHTRVIYQYAHGKYS